MIHLCIRRILIGMALALAPRPAIGQMVVYDPSNYAQTRWQNALAAYQDALRVQAGVVQGLETSRSQTNGLLSSSQSATGLLQANQVGNQLIALQTRQLLDLTALIAAQSRAQRLDGARLAPNQQQGRTQFNQFLTPRRRYQPQTVHKFPPGGLNAYRS